MFALVLMGTLLVSHQTLAAPSNCGTASICDHKSGRQIDLSGQNNGGYSSYSKWGSHSSWSSGSTNSGANNGQRSGNIEIVDDNNNNNNAFGTSNLDRQGSWRDQKSYVTDDHRGKIDYSASQEVTANSFRKTASSSYRYGSNDYHDLQPNSQLIPHTQFDSQIQDVQNQMQSFIGQFSGFGSSKSVTQSMLDNYKIEAQNLINRASDLCNQVDVNSAQYRQAQQMKQRFQNQVQQQQQAMMSFAFQSSQTVSGSVNTNVDTGVSNAPYVRPTYYPSPRPVYQPAPIITTTTISPLVIESQRIQQESGLVRTEVNSFYTEYLLASYKNFENEAQLASFRKQAMTAIASLEQKLATLRAQSAHLDYERRSVEDISATLQNYVSNLQQQLDSCEKRIHDERVRQIEEQERLNQQLLEEEKRQSELRYQEQMRLLEDERLKNEKLIEQKRKDEEARLERQRFEALQKYENEQRINEQLIKQQQQKLKWQQQQPVEVQTIAPTTNHVVKGGYSHQVNVEFSGSQQYVSGGGSHGELQQQQQVHQIAPHIDITDAFRKMNQEYNKLFSSVNNLGAYSMQLTADNQQSVNAQFQQEFGKLQHSLDNLCQQSNQYNNKDVLQASEQLKQQMEEAQRYFQEKLAEFQASIQDNSSWQTSGRYSNVRQPQVGNAEFSSSQSTEVEVKGRHALGQQNVLCVEALAGQPCIEPPRKRREAGGYYSQQQESNYDEHTPRRGRHQRRRTYELEDDDYSQQHADPQLELSDYSRDRQSIRSQQHERQSQDSYQHDDNDSYNQRYQHGRRHSSQYGQQETEDLSQQYVQSGQHEDFTTYEKPRRERVQNQQFERLENFDEQDNQQFQAADLQRESSTSTSRTLLDQRLVVDEPQEFVKPIVEPNRQRESIDNFNLEQSGFYDNPKSRENSELNDNMQQSYEKPSLTQIVEDKPSNADLTLENSGLVDHQQRVVTDSTPEQVTTFKNFDDSHKSEDMTLQNSGFFDQSDRQGRLSRVPALNRHNEELVQQQSSNLDDSFSRQQRVNDDSSQMQIGYDDTQKDMDLSGQNRSYELPRNHHPRGQYIHNLPQQHEQFSPNIIDFGSNGSDDQLNTADRQIDRNLAQSESQESLAAYNSSGSQTRYEEPVEANQNINQPQHPENQYYGHNSNENVHERTSNFSHNLNEFGPHRGDLPGQSQPIDEKPERIPLQSTTPVPIPRPQAPVTRPYIPGAITEKPSQNIVEPGVPTTERTPCYSNRCLIDRLGQLYYYRQQNHHNIRFSQSIYNNQQNHETSSNSGYHNQNPFYQHNVQSNQQINHAPQHGGYTYSYTSQQRNHLRINHQGSTQPLGTEATAFEQNDLLGLNGQESSQQVYQKPMLDNVSGHRGFNQRQSTYRFNQQSSQNSEGFPGQVVPLYERQSGDKWAEMESTTGQKLSNAYDSVRGSARTIYG